MAEAWAKKLKSETVDVHSAGVDPHGMNARAVKAMAEVGIDISHYHSKHVDELKGMPFDFVITVCDHANETCPVFPGKVKRIHVGFDDPPRLAKDAKSEEEAMVHYRRVRDEIRAYIQTLPQALGETER
jgi:arsenate reductase